MNTIETKNFTLQPAWENDNDRSAELAAAIHKAGDFELYFGLKETKLLLDILSIARPMFYNILGKDGSFIGYIGFHREGTDNYEFEIYILKPHRRRGYAKEVLSTAIRAAFNGDIEGMGKCERIVASVRFENIPSHALMKSVGFAEKEDIPFLMRISPVGNSPPMQLKYYYLTKDMLTEQETSKYIISQQ